jgi:hypothetical protein
MRLIYSKVFIEITAATRGVFFKFEIIGVYGPADHARSELFLQELEAKVNSCQHPVVVGGILTSLGALRIRAMTILTGLECTSSMIVLETLL